MLLDEDAALQSTSWGLGQVNGGELRICRVCQCRDMVAAMVMSEDNQLEAMAKFIVKSGMADLLKDSRLDVLCSTI